jgi:hypothetical protein
MAGFVYEVLELVESLRSSPSEAQLEREQDTLIPAA